MAILENERWELFAQSLAKGETATKAYSLAGFRAHRGNAARLRADECVRQRVLEIQAASAKSAEINITSICRELDAAIQVAQSKGQANAMVSAAGLRAKLAGLMIERHEIGAPGAFETCTTVEEVADEMLHYFRSGPVAATEAEKQGLVELIERYHRETQEYVAAIAAKPVEGQRSPAEIEHRRALFGGNGRQRRS